MATVYHPAGDGQSDLADVLLRVLPGALSKSVPIWCAVVNRALFPTETAYSTINTLKYAPSPKLQCSFLLAFPHSSLTAQQLPLYSAYFHMHLLLFNIISHSLVFVLKLCYNPLSFFERGHNISNAC